jgi:hypothetical protein
MKKNTTKLVVIIALISCTIALLSCGIFVACKAWQDDNKPNTPLNSIEDDDYWTNNY